MPLRTGVWLHLLASLHLVLGSCSLGFLIQSSLCLPSYTPCCRWSDCLAAVPISPHIFCLSTFTCHCSPHPALWPLPGSRNCPLDGDLPIATSSATSQALLPNLSGRDSCQHALQTEAPLYPRFPLLLLPTSHTFPLFFPAASPACHSGVTGPLSFKNLRVFIQVLHVTLCHILLFSPELFESRFIHHASLFLNVYYF